VVINEGIELAKRFGATEAHRYVNAVLDRASKAHRGAEREAPAVTGSGGP
jgi:N utilization substance protein B